MNLAKFYTLFVKVSEIYKLFNVLFEYQNFKIRAKVTRYAKVTSVYK